MRPFLVAAAVTAITLSVTPAAHAHAPLTDAPLCEELSVSDPQVEGSRTGVYQGGPILIGNQLGYLRCTIQVNASTHDGSDACWVPGPMTYASVSASGTCTYASAEEDNVYLCTEVTITGPVDEIWYWHHTYDLPASGFWSRYSFSSCELQTTVQIIDPQVDPLVCPALAVVFPPQGDITLPVTGKLWDCPPYDS